MSDIHLVGKLRSRAYTNDRELRDLAADRIERLKAMLEVDVQGEIDRLRIGRLEAALQYALHNIAPANADHAEIKARIRAALEGK